MTTKTTKTTTEESGICYVRIYPFQLRDALHNKKDISGIFYKKSGSHYRRLIRTLPHNTIIRFWNNLDQNQNKISTFTALWDKHNKRIISYF
jgi:hypothetical protein